MAAGLGRERILLEMAFLGNDIDAAQETTVVEAMVYVDDRSDVELPFRTFVRAVTHDPLPFEPVASVGTYFVYSRLEKAPSSPLVCRTPELVTINAFVRRAELSHREADDHWRLSHAPLARRHHPGVSKYVQLSVVHVVAGVEYDGFAILEFCSVTDFRQHFYDSPEGRKVILSDVSRMADLERSPRGLVARQLGRS